MSRSSTVIGPFVSRFIYAAAYAGALFSFSLLAILVTPVSERPVNADLSIGVSTIPAGASPVKAAVNLFTNKIYVANHLSGNVTVIDGDTNTAVTVAAGTFPGDIAVNPLTNRIYVPNSGSANVTVIDGSDNSTMTIPAGLGPGKIAVDPLTNKIYVANADSRDITVINGANNSTSTVAIGAEPDLITADPATNKVYFTVPSANFVGVLDGSTNALSNVPVSLFPGAIAVNPATSKLYIADSTANQVVVFDSVRGSTETIGVGVTPRALAVDPTANKIYVANFGGNDLTVIDGNDNTTSQIAIGFGLSFVAANPAVNKIYTGSRFDGRVLEIDGVSTFPTTIFTGATPFNAVINPITNKVYVVNVSPSITVIDPAPKNTGTLNTAITPLPGNITGNPSPAFTLIATSNSSPPQSIYFQIDATTGMWARAKNIGQTGTALTARAVTANLRQGMHIIYFYASDGAQPGDISAYPFFVNLTPVAAEVSVAGRVLTASGIPLRNAWVELLDSHGLSRTAFSSSLGYYRFDGVGTGKSYTVSASAKRYRFDAQFITVNNPLSDLDLIARGGMERQKKNSRR